MSLRIYSFCDLVSVFKYIEKIIFKLHSKKRYSQPERGLQIKAEAGLLYTKNLSTYAERLS